MKMNLDSVHRELYEYWALRAGARSMPARTDLRPEDVTGILKHVGLIDVVHRPEILRFRYRLVGTRMNFIFGHDFTSSWLHEAKHGAYRDFLHVLYADAVRNRRPVLSESEFQYRGLRQLRVKRLVLPLSGDGDQVDMLMFANTFASDDHDFGFRPYPPEDILDFSEVLREAA